MARRLTGAGGLVIWLVAVCRAGRLASRCVVSSGGLSSLGRKRPVSWVGMGFPGPDRIVGWRVKRRVVTSCGLARPGLVSERLGRRAFWRVRDGIVVWREEKG